MAKGYGRPPMCRKGGKGMGMGMPGLNMDMIKQAQKMQADMERTQAELQEKEYTATAGGGRDLRPWWAGIRRGLRHSGWQAYAEGIEHRPRGSGPGGCGNAPGYGDCCGQ